MFISWFFWDILNLSVILIHFLYRSLKHHVWAPCVHTFTKCCSFLQLLHCYAGQLSLAFLMLFFTVCWLLSCCVFLVLGVIYFSFQQLMWCNFYTLIALQLLDSAFRPFFTQVGASCLYSSQLIWFINIPSFGWYFLQNQTSNSLDYSRRLLIQIWKL